MKKIILLLPFIMATVFFCFDSQAQNLIGRMVFFDQEKIALKSEYTVLKEKPLVKHGLYTEWYLGDFYGTGKQTTYEKGNIWKTGLYENGQPVGEWNFYYINGVQSAKGFYRNGQRNEHWIFYFYNGKISHEGNYVNGVKTGDWKYYDTNQDGKIHFSVNANQELAETTVTNTPNNKANATTTNTEEDIDENIDEHTPIINPNANDVLEIAEISPEFAGGEASLARFYAANLLYPFQAEEMGVSGTVFIECIIDEYGFITEPKVVRGLGSGCDEEALRVVKAMPRWQPAMQSGKRVSVKYTLQVKFIL
ncbi:MAG: TonB family protein [Sphingobacteriales bacterium]|jgi:TonB family protein|nr:TonB family protein [Sphingobacteriales bacterium]MBP9141877.1 TonB family protein [Chitinophagales bacterium]MDA0199293.1 TonB family protein [Bacteroidota bacterium]MBK7528752.1 TonB family protein [Sphingobacteriales bacterium]MBL0246854.1 TonB family protein [Sphingobacteriales bacterium]